MIGYLSGFVPQGSGASLEGHIFDIFRMKRTGGIPTLIDSFTRIGTFAVWVDSSKGC